MTAPMARKLQIPGPKVQASCKIQNSGSNPEEPSQAVK